MPSDGRSFRGLIEVADGGETVILSTVDPEFYDRPVVDLPRPFSEVIRDVFKASELLKRK